MRGRRIYAADGKSANDLKNLSKADELGCSVENTVQLYDLLGIICFDIGRYNDALVNLEMAEHYAELSMDYYFDCVTYEIQKYQTDKDKQHYHKALEYITEALATLNPTASEVAESIEPDENGARDHLTNIDDISDAAEEPYKLDDLGFVTSSCVLFTMAEEIQPSYLFKKEENSYILKEKDTLEYNISTRRLNVIESSVIDIIPPNDMPQKDKSSLLDVLIPTVISTGGNAGCTLSHYEACAERFVYGQYHAFDVVRNGRGIASHFVLQLYEEKD